MAELEKLVFDASLSVRSVDANGYLHVAMTPISKACVNPYLGREIPGWEKRGLEPERIYYALRDGGELAKAAESFNGLPVLMNHHQTDAENPAKEYTVGSTGTDAVFDTPYLKNSMSITDAEAIRAIKDGSAKEISCAYRFTPDFTPGEFEAPDGSSVHYDFIIRDIAGNHVALVAEGRAGHDVYVADAMPQLENKKRSDTMDMEKGTATAAEIIDKLLPELDAEKKAALIEAIAKLHEGCEAADTENPLVEGEEPAEKAEESKEAEPEAEKQEENAEFKAGFEAGLKAAAEKAEKPEVSEDSIAAIKEETIAGLRRLNEAARKVRPLVGEITDPMAFDSADDIYKFALKQNGQDVEKYPAAAYGGMVDVMLAAKTNYVMDAAPKKMFDEKTEAAFERLKRIN